MRIFVDSNVIVYSRDRRDAEKRTRARHWLRFLTEREWAVINLQIVNETTDVLLRRLGSMTEQKVRQHTEQLIALGDSPVGLDEVALAWEIRARFGFRWWDSLIVSAALLLECSYLLTEDMQHGQTIGKLTIVDPFRTSPETLAPAS